MQDIRVFFMKGFARCNSKKKMDSAVTLPQSAQRKHAFTGKIKDVSKKNKFPERKKLL